MNTCTVIVAGILAVISASVTAQQTAPEDPLAVLLKTHPSANRVNVSEPVPVVSLIDTIASGSGLKVVFDDPMPETITFQGGIELLDQQKMFDTLLANTGYEAVPIGWVIHIRKIATGSLSTRPPAPVVTPEIPIEPRVGDRVGSGVLEPDVVRLPSIILLRPRFVEANYRTISPPGLGDIINWQQAEGTPIMGLGQTQPSPPGALMPHLMLEYDGRADQVQFWNVTWNDGPLPVPTGKTWHSAWQVTPGIHVLRFQKTGDPRSVVGQVRVAMNSLTIVTLHEQDY